MKVLMFGWEFPPHIAGGLGTACEGIVKGLAHNGVQTLFVMPRASGDEDQSATTIIDASDVEVRTVSRAAADATEAVKYLYVDSNIVPYVDPEEYFSAIEKMKTTHTEVTTVGFGQKFRFSGKYGANLMEEVARYAQVGGTIAVNHRDEFDVIHAHDWLT
ncbi:MAG: glycogen/starch synthase, partial [Bacteroidales bacterium]|nr:glycogen/starch synthase [Bacteroidales bacterium]